MVSYSNSGYENDFFDVSEVYFNSTPQSSSSSAVDLDELDARYLLKSGGTVSSNLIVSGSVDIKTALTLPTIGNVKDAIQGKQNTINDGDLTIARTAELQTTLNGKQNTINDGDLTIARTAELQTTLNGKQNTINDGDLTIARTAELQTALDDKQDEIISTTDLTLNSIPTDDLIVNNLNVDNTIEDMTGRSEKGGKSYDHFCGELNEELDVGYDWMYLNRDVQSCHLYRKSNHIVTNHLLCIFRTCPSFSAQLSFCLQCHSLLSLEVGRIYSRMICLKTIFQIKNSETTSRSFEGAFLFDQAETL